jgi:thioredoxin-related protein
LFFVFCFSGDDILWTSLEKAKKISKKEKKPIMLMVTYKYCPECRYVKNIIYKDKKIKDTINNKYIPVVYEFNDKKLPKKFKKWGVPRFYFLNSSLDIKGYHLGGLRIKKMQDLLNKNLKAIK